MATGRAQSGTCRDDREVLQVIIDRYELEPLLREAKHEGVISEMDKQEIERQGILNGPQGMREHFIKVVLSQQSGQQQLVDFVRYYAELVKKISDQSLAKFNALQVTRTHVNDWHYADNSRDTGSLQLSQDKGYCSISGTTSSITCTEDSSSSAHHNTTTQPSCFDVGYLEASLKQAQSVQQHLQKHIAKKQQYQQQQCQQQQSRQLTANPQTLNFTSQPDSPLVVHIGSVTNHYYMGSQSQMGSQSFERKAICSCPATRSQPAYEGSKMCLQHRDTDEWNRMSCDISERGHGCLKEHFNKIVQCLNMKILLPHLFEKNLITRYESQKLENMVQHDQNLYFLLSILPGKGKDAFERFLECLKDEKGHLGHQDLAKCLGRSYEVAVTAV